MEPTIIMELVCTIGAKLAMSGAETYRVEESVRRIAAAYGIEGRVYSVPNSLFVTLVIPGRQPMTQLCRIDHHSTNLEAVERYSNLSRRICAQTPDPALAMEWVSETEKGQKHYGLPMALIGHILVACGFCVFFGGSWNDCLCAGLCGLLLGILSPFLSQSNTFFQKIISGFAMAFLAYSLSAMGLTRNVDTCVIGTLMLLVPGLLFTNALRDIIFGDTNSGINRIVEVLLIAAAIALGTAAAWNLAQSLWVLPVNAPILAHTPVIQCLFAMVACLGFVVVFNIHGYGNLLCVLGGGLTWAAYCLVQHLGGAELLCYFLATVFAAVFAELMARVRKYPAISYLITSLLPLIPGAGVYYSAQQAMQGNTVGFVEYSAHTLAIAGVMAAGILLVVSATRILSSYHKRTGI